MERSLFPLELQLGMEVDPTFGPILILGQATQRGIDGAELTYLLPPLDATLTHAMLDDTPIGRFLAQQRHGAALRDGVVDVLVRLAGLVVELPAVRRLAIDPLLVSHQRLVVLDAHVELGRPDRDPGARLAIRPYPRELEQTATLRDGSRSACGRSGPTTPRRCSSCSTTSRPTTGAGACSPRCARCPTRWRRG